MGEKQTILVVDDEQDLLDLIDYNLEKEGYKVITAIDGVQGLEMMRKNIPDLVLLDIMMPEMDGIEVVEKVRKDEDLKHLPVIFLTARSDEQSEVTGLDKGGDDYIKKPISLKQLISRIKAVLRRTGDQTNGAPQNVVNVHDLTIDKDRYLVIKDEEEFHLPRKEFELLYFLAGHPGKVFDRKTILNRIWGTEVYVVDRTIDVHVRKIRMKIGKEYIETVKGVGYRFKA